MNFAKKARVTAEIAVVLVPAIVTDVEEIRKDVNEAREPDSDGGEKVTLNEVRSIVAENLVDSDTIDAIASIVHRHVND